MKARCLYVEYKTRYAPGGEILTWENFPRETDGGNPPLYTGAAVELVRYAPDLVILSIVTIQGNKRTYDRILLNENIKDHQAIRRAIRELDECWSAFSVEGAK